MKDLRKKLHNSKGETILEVLMSVLICTLSVALLFSGVVAANKINRQAETADSGFFEALNDAERKDAASPFQTDKTIMVTEKEGGTGVKKYFTVNQYGNDTIYSYKLAPKKAVGGDSNP